MTSIDTPLSKTARVLPPEAHALKKLGIETVGDLLRHFPVRYGDTSEMRSIDSLERGMTAVVFGKITKLKTSKGFRTKIPMASAEIEDESGRIQCVWFNQPYLAKIIPEGAFVRIEGKVSQRKVKSREEKEKGRKGEKEKDEISVEYEDESQVEASDTSFGGLPGESADSCLADDGVP